MRNHRDRLDQRLRRERHTGSAAGPYGKATQSGRRAVNGTTSSGNGYGTIGTVNGSGIGETNGPFVAGKTSAGFVVRELHAGHSTLTFDYRIVAAPLGAADSIMAMKSPAAARALVARATPPVVPAVNMPPHLRTPAVEPETP